MRLIDADELMEKVKKWLPPDPCGREEKEFPFETDICVSMLMEIAEAPTEVELVRCKDCKHFYFADNRIPQEQRYVCEISGEIWKPDSFCSYGKRREE